MRKPLLALVLAAATATTMAAPVAVEAQPRHDYRWDGDRGRGGWDPADHYRSGRYRERRLTRADQVYRGHDGRYYCRRSDGTTGLVVGAALGGILGNAVGGDTLSTLLGAGAGGLLGRSVDRGDVRCR